VDSTGGDINKFRITDSDSIFDGRRSLTKVKAEKEIYSRAKSFQYAGEGWWYVLKTQHNAWIHALITFCVVSMGVWLQLSTADWAILILAIMVVWMAEFMNTALEVVVDLSTNEFHPLAKIAKDVAAACVLLGAIGAAIIGLLIMTPPLIDRLF
jgi:diacylglycerol kinase